MSNNWHEQHPGNLYQLCHWLVSEVGDDAETLLEVIEKPGNWKREWGLCELWYQADREKNERMKQRCVEAVIEGETTADMVALEFSKLIS